MSSQFCTDAESLQPEVTQTVPDVGHEDVEEPAEETETETIRSIATSVKEFESFSSSLPEITTGARPPSAQSASSKDSDDYWDEEPTPTSDVLEELRKFDELKVTEPVAPSSPVGATQDPIGAENRVQRPTPPAPIVEPPPSSPVPSTTSQITLTPPSASTAPAAPVAEQAPGPEKSAVVVIAHSQRHQAYLDRRELAWGVQWEIARLIANGDIDSWDNIHIPTLDQLRGTNAEAAPKVIKLLLPSSSGAPQPSVVEPASLGESPWAELDREQRAIVEGRGRGLGCFEEDEESDSWKYGGNVLQRAKLHFKPPSAVGTSAIAARFSITLEPQKRGASSRLARFLGSRRLIQLSLPKEVLYNYRTALKDYLENAFILNGRVFRVFHVKDGHAHLMETSESYEREPSEREGDHFRLSLADLIDWANPLYFNRKQPMSKWSSRFSLFLSSTRPGVSFERRNVITDLRDIRAPRRDGEAGPSANRTMTDGCGLINTAALQIVQRELSLQSLPVAVQGRISGAKGMWLRHPTNDDLEPMIWIRESQIKIAINDDDLFILDVLNTDYAKSPATLSIQTINNLSHGGVPDDVFVKLLSNALAASTAIFDWTRPDGIWSLWYAAWDAGNLVKAKLRREFSPSPFEVAYDGEGVDDDDETYDMDTARQALCGWMDPMSGIPDSFHEFTIGLLEAGFNPARLPALRDCVWTILGLQIDSCVRKYKIPVPMSLLAFIVPDPLGVLKPNEVHFKASQPILRTATGPATHVTGDVLLARIPVLLPSDVKKVRAINHPELDAYTDVIVFPTSGHRSLASELSGGDYDGDMVYMYWQPELVESFSNSESTNPPPGLRAEFEEGTETGEAFISRTSELGEEEQFGQIQRYLMAGANESYVGQYSEFYAQAIYRLGYGHPETIRLAHIVAACLDSPRTGRYVKSDVYHRDARLYGNRQPPHCLDFSTPRERQRIGKPDERRPPFERTENLPPFVLDTLYRAKKDQRARCLMEFSANVKEKIDVRQDRQLLAPLEDAQRRARSFNDSGDDRMENELARLQRFVDSMHGLYLKVYRSIPGAINYVPDTPPMSESESTLIKDKLRKVSRMFAKGATQKNLMFFSKEEALRVMASYAYLSDIERSRGKKCNFAFRMAYRELCAIKAAARSSVALVQEFADKKMPHRGFRRVQTSGSQT
ncbi:hypothetical protein BOTBODRAFT_224345 [Botryobasidium botryosum FD-172 SS1]|uniref:RNA-dependent RNA polymerase n=1 Tax=Botryobasidium botryosum (strain FD-172 SS1) TaxID=930990 RepID=A0A067MYS7_BOTB1|nr:hypothetical protein BOTBODRAFT_224345 [Botryobasidium botryosum FD-172 SS1]